MCMSAIYWSRCEAVYFSQDLQDTQDIGFSDEYQYDDFKKPIEERSTAWCSSAPNSASPRTTRGGPGPTSTPTDLSPPPRRRGGGG
ncbi:hypothetical protein [Kitasatospora xanthocidica]|uniref:hypothetical protein n=1 Tax=Kitasatospora xanthocidica TaxID=83382 RepID=UPI00216B2996